MLHAVADGPRQVVGEERVAPAFVRREFAEDGALFAHDLAKVRDEPVHVGGDARVMHRDRNVRRRPGDAWREVRLERAPLERTQFDRTVHQIRQVRRRHREGIVGRKQLRGETPVGSRQAGRRSREPARIRTPATTSAPRAR